ncbi:MAG: hypothetical protein DCC51_13995 [Anaerolineae bacterium]|nr:MAG: hypothetical protein DCC51_13995 [Anaerolineae bacterium]
MLATLLDHLRTNRDFTANVVAWERIPSRPARYASMSTTVDPRLVAALRGRGIEQLYSHQATAVDAVARGENVIVATATASGKSLVYTLPVLSRLAVDPAARALYLFPTKALAHDQEAETAAIINAARLPVQVNTYDGDTPRGKRSGIRQSGGVLITNPDMLHAGILPFHPTWRSLFGWSTKSTPIAASSAAMWPTSCAACSACAASTAAIRSSSAPRPPSPTRRSTPNV